MPNVAALAFNKSIEQEWIRRVLAGLSPPSFPLTAEQEAIISYCLSCHAAGSPIRLNIVARAGSGKTFILFEVLRRLGINLSAELRQSRTGSYLTSPDIKTTHALCLAAWKAKGFNVNVFGGKDRKLAKTLGLFKEPISQENATPVALPALALTAKAKTVGISPGDRGSPLIPDTDQAWMELADHYGILISPRIIEASRQLLSASIDLGKKPRDVTVPARAGKRAFTVRNSVEIDFADMIYLPIIFSAPFDRYDLIVLDEEQDFSPLRAEVVYRCSNQRTSIIGAGDPAQAIYAFTGADTRAMENMAARLGLTTLPLTMSQRCSKAVIASAQSIVPDIQARPDAPEGSEQFPESMTVSALPSTVLCRNNAPLIALAIYALTKRRPVALLGRDDVMKELEDLYTAVVGQASYVSLQTFYSLLTAHLQGIIRRSKRLPKTTKDNAAALLALAYSVEQERSLTAPASEIITILHSLYPEEEKLQSLPPSTLLLSTIHKSKGLEWPAVGILDAGLIGAFAKQDWEQEAESNLHYVGKTRAINDLIYIDSRDIEGFDGRIPCVDVAEELDDEDEDDGPAIPPVLAPPAPLPEETDISSLF
jgi:hypothetical protein